MRIEIAHDALAKKVYEKSSTEDKMLLRVLRLVNERYDAFSATKTYLSRQEINFITPFINQLDDILDDDEYQFILRSKVFRRRQIFAIIGSIIVVFLGLVVGVLLLNASKNAAWTARAKAENESRANKMVISAMQNEEIAPALALKLTLAADKLTDNNDTEIDQLTRLIFRRNNFSNKELVHKGVVYGAAFAPNGKEFATASMDKLVRIWNLKGELSTALVGHKRMVNDVAYSPDGKRLVSVSDDSTAIIWDLGEDKVVKILKKHTADVNAVKYSPDGKYILTGSRDKTAILWSADGDSLKTFKGHGNSIYDVDFSPLREDYIATASKDSTVRVWNINTGRTIVTLEHEHSVHGVEFSPKNLNEIATGCRDDYARIWSINQSKMIKRFRGHTAGVINVEYSPTGDTLLTGSWDHTARLWNVNNEKVIRILIGHSDYVLGLAYSPNGDQIVTGGRDYTARVWNLRLRRNIKTFEEHTKRVQSVSFSKDLSYALTGSWDKTAILWDLKKQTVVKRYKFDKDVEAVEFHPSSKAFAVASGRNVFLYYVGKDKPAHKYVGHTKTVKTIKFSSKGDRMLTGGRDGIAIFWDVWRHKMKFTLKKHKYDILSVDFTRNQDTLVTSSWDRTIMLWDTTGKHIRTIEGHTSRIYSISTSKNKPGMLLSSDLEGSIRLWNTGTGELLNVWNTSNSVFSVKFVPNQDYFVSAGGDNQAKLWNLKGDCLQVFEHESDIYAVDVAEDMSYIFTATQEEGAKIFYTLEGFLKSNHFEDITVLDEIKFNLIEVQDIQLEESYDAHEIEVLRKLAAYLEEEGLALEDIKYLQVAKRVHDKILAMESRIAYDKEMAGQLYAELALFQLIKDKYVSAESRKLIKEAILMAPNNPEVILMKANFLMMDNKAIEAKIFYEKLKGRTYGRNYPMTRKAISELNDLMNAGLVSDKNYQVVEGILKQ